MAKWIDVVAEAEVADGNKKCLDILGFPIIIYNIHGRFAATYNLCPHAGLAIGDGDLTGGVITCPYHAYTFDVCTGRNVDDPDAERLMTLKVRCEGGRVEVELPIAE